LLIIKKVYDTSLSDTYTQINSRYNIIDNTYPNKYKEIILPKKSYILLEPSILIILERKLLTSLPLSAGEVSMRKNSKFGGYRKKTRRNKKLSINRTYMCKKLKVSRFHP